MHWYPLHRGRRRVFARYSSACVLEGRFQSSLLPRFAPPASGQMAGWRGDAWRGEKDKDERERGAGAPGDRTILPGLR